MTYRVEFVYGRIGSRPAVTIGGRSIPAPIMGYHWVIMDPETGFALVTASNGQGTETKEQAEVAFRKATAAMTEALVNLEAEA